MQRPRYNANKPRREYSTRPVSVRIRADMLNAFDGAAARLRVSRAQLFEQLILQHLKERDGLQAFIVEQAKASQREIVLLSERRDTLMEMARAMDALGAPDPDKNLF